MHLSSLCTTLNTCSNSLNVQFPHQFRLKWLVVTYLTFLMNVLDVIDILDIICVQRGLNGLQFHTNSHLQPCELNINHTAGVDKLLVCAPWTDRLRVQAIGFSFIVAQWKGLCALNLLFLLSLNKVNTLFHFFS